MAQMIPRETPGALAVQTLDHLVDELGDLARLRAIRATRDEVTLARITGELAELADHWRQLRLGDRLEVDR